MSTASDFDIDTCPERLNLDLIHHFLSTESTWAQAIPREVMEKSLRHSLCFGAYSGEQQIGFARVISDYATFANLVDVFVLEEHRGQNISKQLMQAVLDHPELQGLRRFTLATADAHGLYAQFGFEALNKPESFMQRYDPGIYKP